MTTILTDLPDEYADDEVGSRLSQIISSLNGYAGQGIQINLVEYNSASKYAQKIRNSGTAGLHWAVYHSTANPKVAGPIVAVQDSGLYITGTNLVLAGGTTTLGGTLHVTGEIFGDDGLDIIGGAVISGEMLFNGHVEITSRLDVDGLIASASTITGTRLISTIATGTAPLSVASTTKVANLNADLLDDHDSTYFATEAELANYVLKAGDTMSGDLNILGATLHVRPGGGGNDQAIFFRHNSGRGEWALGATNVAATDAIFKDPTGTERFRVGHSSNPHAAEVNGQLYVSNLLTAHNALTVDTGNLTVTAGGVSAGASSTFTGGVTLIDSILTLNGGQVAFPATQVASGGANVLDDYEEGTFNFNLGGSESLSVKGGTYTKIGNRVTFEGRITVTSLGTGSTSVISGLPFASATVSAAKIGYWQFSATPYATLSGYISGTSISLWGTTGAVASMGGAVFFQASSDIVIAGSYSV